MIESGFKALVRTLFSSYRSCIFSVLTLLRLRLNDVVFILKHICVLLLVEQRLWRPTTSLLDWHIVRNNVGGSGPNSLSILVDGTGCLGQNALADNMLVVLRMGVGLGRLITFFVLKFQMRVTFTLWLLGYL